MEMDGYKKRFDWASLILGIVLVVLGTQTNRCTCSVS